MAKFGKRGKHSFVFYGRDGETGEYIPPLASHGQIDAVTGAPIPGGLMGNQDGLVKDVRPLEGSWEKPWRHDANELPVNYDPARGVQQKPAGYVED